jgi:SAM-dependent methyltransferase
VADLAAGTGKLTRALVAGGYDVVAVEPQPELRDILAGHVGADRVREGTAEALPLEDASVDLVTVADGFHWFDPQPALAEIRRVLRPGGTLAILVTTPDWSGASWAHEVGQALSGLRREHPYFDGPSWKDAVAQAGGWTEPVDTQVSVEAPFEPSKLPDYLLSISWVAGAPLEDRERALAIASRAISDGITPPTYTVHTLIGTSSLAV